jgi:group II intron reverse transcriptase/maturase
MSAVIPAAVLAGQLDLAAALSKVRAKAGMAGVDGMGTDRYARGFALIGSGAICRLLQPDYRPDPLRAAELVKKNGSLRLLLIPTVADRVLQTATAAWLARKWNPGFDAASFAYRPGLGVAHALRALAEYREAGFRWVLDADLRNFFDSIPHDKLSARLTEDLGPAAAVGEWVQRWTAATVWDGEQVGRTTKGVPQGSPLSPLLANFYLDAFDRTLRRHSIPLIRYADDFLVLARTPFELTQMREIAEACLTSLGLELNGDKTRVTSFDQGFRFLGANITKGDILLPFAKTKSPKRPAWVAPTMGAPLLRAFRAGLLRCTTGWEWTPRSVPAPATPATVHLAAGRWRPAGGEGSPLLEQLRRLK